MNELAVVHAIEPAMAEATGKTELELAAQNVCISGRFARLQLIQTTPVGVGDGRHIGELLESTLNLQAGDAAFGELGQQIPGGQILGRHQIALFAEIAFCAIHNQLIRKPAGLGTFAAVGAALA